MSTIDINTNQSDQQTQTSQKPAVSRWTVLGDRMRMVRNRFVYIRRRELRMYSRRPVFLFCMIIAPLLCIFFFTTLMWKGLPTRLPAAVVDEDNTHVTRIVTRLLDAFEETDVKYVYHNFHDARKAMQEGKIYAFFYLPKGLTADCESQRQPTISFYTNDTYYVPANLLFKDMKTASALAGLALTRSSLWGKGVREDRIMGLLQPIAIETHPLKNAFLDYSAYLNNMLVPGIIMLLIMLTTTYTLGLEWKENHQIRLYIISGKSPAVVFAGKLLAQTVIYTIILCFMDVWFYRFCGFPCNSGILFMFGLSLLTVLACQGFGVFLFGLMAGEMRLAMCICSLWGILSFSITGFTFPVTAMSPYLRFLSYWFPLRHYYLIYVNSTLNGFPIHYVWPCVAALIGFVLLPILVLPRYHTAFKKFKYIE
jgi:ABC-2 type transport system permease protein